MQLKILGIEGATSLGLVNTVTKNMSVEDLKACLVKTKLNEEQMKQILMNHGVGASEAEGIAATLAVSQAEMAATASTGALTTATGGLSAAFRGLTVAMASNPIGAIAVAAATVIGVVSTAVTVFSNWSNSIEDVADSANDLKKSFDDIDSYISKINDLKTALNVDSISQTEATEKRKQLLEIQEELIKKYGQEKDAVDYITESIQGETSALIQLKKEAAKNWNDTHVTETKNANQYFNGNSFLGVNWGSGQQVSSKKWINQWADENGKNIYIMPNSSGTQVGFSGTIDEILATMDEFHNAVETKIKEYESKDSLNWYEQQELQGFKELKSEILERKSELLSSDEYKTNKTIYDTAVENLILTDDKYSEYYEKIVEKKKAYTEALASGNQDEITQAYTELRDIFHDIFNLDFVDEDNVSGESIKNWFADVQKQVYQQSKETPIIVDVQAELEGSPDGYSNKIKEIVNKNNYTSDDINSILSKGDLNYESLSGDEKNLYDNIKGYIDLWNGMTDATGQAEIKVEQYIGALEKLGIVKTKVAEKNDESSFALSKDQTKELKSVHSDVDKLNKAYQNLFAGKLTTNDVVELVDLFPTLGEYVDWTDEKFGNLAEGIDKVIKERPQELIGQLEKVLNTQDLSDEAKKSIQSMIAALKQLKPELKDTKTLIEDIQKAIKGVSSSISTLIGFTKEISENGSLSLSSIDTIMTDDTYQSLRPYINDMEGMQTAITELVAKQKDAYEDLYNAEMYENDYEAYHKAVQEKEKDNENLLGDSIKQIQDEIKYFNDFYGIDITNWDNLSEIKKAALQNTNAELLSKQGKLIKDFGQLYNDDITNFSNAIKAKAEIQKHFEESQVYSKINNIIDNDSKSGAFLDKNTGKLKRYASPEAQEKINALLSSYGLTYADYANYRDYGKFTQSGNVALEKVLDELIKPYKITTNTWNKLTGNTKSSGDSSDSGLDTSTTETGKVFDWIERRLKKFANNTKQVFSKIGDYITFKGKNKQISKSINAIEKEISFNKNAYGYYMNEANKVGLGSYWKKAVREGGKNLSEIKNADLKEKIENYQELYDKAISCRDAVSDLKETEKEYIRQRLDNIETYYENRINYINADSDYYNNLDKDTRSINKNYKKLGKNYKKTEKYETDKAANLYGQLQDDIKHGRIKVGDDDYYKYKTDIKNAQSNARQAANARHQLAVEELGDIQTRWENRSGTYGSKISMIETKASDTTRKTTKNYSGLRSAYKQQSVYALNEASELQKKLGEAVKNGDIQKYSKAWYEWTENIKKAKENAEEYKKTIHELAVEEFNDIATKHDNKLNQITNQATKLNESIAQTQAKGYLVSTKYYEAQIKNEKKNNAELVSKKNELSIKLQTAIASGDIKVGSQAWYELTDEIEKTDIAIQQSTTSLIEFNNSIRDIKWQIFDLIQEKISQITQESDFLIKLMQNDKLYKEEGQGAGQLTNNGKATMGLHGVNYNTYMAQADKYAKEIIKIDKQLAKDPYNQDLAERREELLKLQQQMILSAEDEKQAIVDMVKEGIELELNALQDLIDKYNEALDSQKDLYDYQKKIKDQTKEITSLQKQLAAYTGDTSEETKSKVQQIKVSLEEAKENLEETQYDKFVSDQKKLLDDLYNEYEKVLNERLDDVDSLISDMIVNINEDANVIKDTLIEQASDVGYKISSTMNNIWKGGAQPVLSEYGINFTNATTNVISAINSLTNSVNTMVSALDKKANNDTNVKKTNSKSATKTNSSKSATKNNSSNTRNIKSFLSGLSGVGDITRNAKSFLSGLSGVPKFKQGTQSVNKSQMAWTQENSIPEAIIRPSDGAILTPLAKGDMILNGNATSNLFSMMNDPSAFIKDNLFDNNSSDVAPNISNNTNSISVSLDNVNFNLPNVKNYDEFIYAMQHDKKFESLIKSMTTDRLFGGSSLKKYHI